MKIESFRDLMRLAHGFETAKVFFTANDLDLFSRLEWGRKAESLADDLAVDGRALTLLLNSLTALGLIEKDGEIYRNTPVAERFLVRGDEYRGSIFRHIHHCWAAWSNLPEVVRIGHPETSNEEAILGKQKEWTRDFIEGMDDVTRDLAPVVVRQLDLGEARVLVDVGGGPGTYAAAFLDAHPRLREVRLFDLPGALEVGRRKLRQKGLLDRIQLVEGNFNDRGFGEGHDVVWISQVFHSQDEEGCRRLIDKAWQALNPGGQLMVHEFLLDEDKASPLGAALFAVHMLVMTEGGRTYSGDEIIGWMEQKGFVETGLKRVSDETAVVWGCKPRI